MSNASQPQIIKKRAGTWICPKHHLLWVPNGGQLLVLVDFAKVGLDGRPSDIRSKFFPWYQGAKKDLIHDLNFWLFENRLASATISQGAASKKTTFLETT